MKQEELLLQLQGLVQEEYLLKRKEELKPLISELKRLQEEIKQKEEYNEELKKRLFEAEKSVINHEDKTMVLNGKVKEAKEKLYGAKGGSLKELLGLQQSVQRMEEEVSDAETDYLENISVIDELKQLRIQEKENVKEMKRNYNEDLRIYKARNQQHEQDLQEVQEKQKQIKEKLSPEVLNVYMETAKRFPSNPVALLQGEMCTGCRISIPSVLQVRIKEAKKLQKCDSCGRIIIYRR